MLTSSGPKVIEFNCRFGDPECQSLMALMGPELAQVLLGCALGCLNQAPKLSIKKQCSACVVAAASGYPEAARENDPVDIQLVSNDSVQVFHAGTSFNQHGELVTSGGRVLSVVAQADSFEKAFTNAYDSLKKIHFPGINYRLDIGHQIRKS